MGAVNIITESSNIVHMPWDVFRFELELKPTGEVEQYLASVTYELQREAGAPVDTLTFVTQTEGKYLERAPRALPRSQIQDSQGALINLLNLTNIYCGQALVRAEARAMKVVIKSLSAYHLQPTAKHVTLQNARLVLGRKIVKGI